MKNYYKTLGISQTSTKEEIKKAFRKLAFEYHPDINNDQKFSDHFKEINEAKQVLLDDYKKYQYDQLLVDFLPKNKVVSRLQKIRTNLHLSSRFKFCVRRKAVIKSLFLGSLFTAIIVTTIVFFKIQTKTPATSAALATADNQADKEPQIIKQVAAPSYPVKKEVKKATFTTEIKKAPQKSRPVIPILYEGKKVAKNQPVDTVRMNKPDLADRTRKNDKKKQAIVTPTTTLVHIDETVLPKQLTEEMMAEILNDVKREKEKFNSKSNCVQVIKTASSNIQNAFLLADFLRKQGYIISGRETIRSTSSGINIDAKNSCIKVIMGTL